MALPMIPVILCAAIYWHGLHCWFLQDDFAWLGLADEWNTFPELIGTLFKPMAQGTIRPISERAFYIVFRNLFDLNAFPYRLLVLLTQFANLVLLYGIARRLLTLEVAALAASSLWCVNSVLAGPMSWTASYNQILCSFVFLLALHFFIRFCDTGLRKYYALQWAVFLFGFGVLEENVVYPFLAATFSLLYARRYLAKALWMVPVSIVYAVLHHAFAKAAHEGIYAIELGAKTLPALSTYWIYSVWPLAFDTFFQIPPAVALFEIGAVSLVLLGFVLLRNFREPAALLGVAWYLITIGPYLLVPNHICDYYPVVPTIGLAILAASAIKWAVSNGTIARIIAATMALSFVIPSGLTAYLQCRKARSESEAARSLIMPFDRLSSKSKNKTIFIQGIDDQLFQSTFYHAPFRLIGMQHVYMTPDDEAKLSPWVGRSDFSEYTRPEPEVLRSLYGGSGLAFRYAGLQVVNETVAYRTILKDKLKSQGIPMSMEPANVLFEEYFKEGWHRVEDEHRWMSQRASFTIGSRNSTGQSLHVYATCTGPQQADAPFVMTARVNQLAIGSSQRIDRCDAESDLLFPLPDGHGEQLEVTLSLNKASIFPPDARMLGLVIRQIEVR